MPGRLFVSSFGAVFFALSVLAKTEIPTTCRYIPGDRGWPTQDDWGQLNTTVGGRLIATDPQAHVCHTPTPNNTACDALRAPWNWDGQPPALCVPTADNMCFHVHIRVMLT